MRKATTKKATKGLLIDVKVVQLGTPIVEVTLKKGQTVKDALKAAGIQNMAVTVKCAGRKVALGDLPENGDRLSIADPVKGA